MILVDFNSLDACEHFALEYYLATERDLGETALLLWRTEPTLMVGKYQNARLEINLPLARALGVKIVRRLSGGGTIYTDPGGWQFSFIDRGGSEEIQFESYIAPVVSALRAMGVPARFNGRNDLTVDGRKFSGNAQYRVAGATVHHGSLLFDTDLARMEALTTPSEEKLCSKSIRSVRERVTNLREHIGRAMTVEAFGRRLAEALAPDGSVCELNGGDSARIREIAARRFEGWDNAIGAAPAFGIERSGRLDGGEVSFRLDIRRGRIEGCAVSGDFFAAVDASAFESALKGCPYRTEDVRAALVRAGLDRAIYCASAGELAQIIAGDGEAKSFGNESGSGMGGNAIGERRCSPAVD